MSKDIWAAHRERAFWKHCKRARWCRVMAGDWMHLWVGEVFDKAYANHVHRIIGRLPDGKHKAEELAAAGLLREAAECAARVRDGDMLTKLQDMIGTGNPLGGVVSQLKDRLQAGVR